MQLPTGVASTEAKEKADVQYSYSTCGLHSYCTALFAGTSGTEVPVVYEYCAVTLIRAAALLVMGSEA